MNILLTGSLILLLIIALVARRAKQGAKPEVIAGTATAKAQRRLAGLGRRPHSQAPDPPRKRRHRPKLGLSVAGLPALQGMVDQTETTTAVAQAQTKTSTASEVRDAEQVTSDVVPDTDWSPSTSSREPVDAVTSPAASGDTPSIALVTPVPLPSAPVNAAWTGDGVLDPAAFIDAPGWPQPREMAYPPPHDSDVHAVDSQPYSAVTRDDAVPTELTGAAGDDDDTDHAFADGVTLPEPASGWNDEQFDPAMGWADDEVVANEIPDALPADWTTQVALVAHTLTGAAGAAATPSWESDEWDATPVDGDVVDNWGEPDWPSPTGDDEVDAEEAPIEETPAATEAPEEPAFAEAPVEWPIPTPDAPAVAEIVTTQVAPLVSHPRPQDHKRTRRLEKRLAAAEAALESIARRTTGKKGDLRNAGKKSIAKHVRKVLADPETARHFTIRIGKGRLTFERCGQERPRANAAETMSVPIDPETAAGANLLAALEGPLRASLLSSTLADYATAEAQRRVADVFRVHNVPRRAPDDFDGLVARLTEIGQGPLLGVSSPERMDG